MKPPGVALTVAAPGPLSGSSSQAPLPLPVATEASAMDTGNDSSSGEEEVIESSQAPPS